MPVYTIKEVQGNAKAHPHLESRGLNGRSVTMTSLDPYALPDFPQIAYHLYSKLLPAFMFANKENTIVPTTRPGYKLVERAPNLIPIAWPPLCVRFKEALSNEETENLKIRGAAVIAAKKPSDIAYTFPGSAVTHELLTLIYRHNKKAHSTCPTPIGAVNLKAYQDLFRVLGIVTWFLKTHVYPAFSNEVSEDAVDGGYYDTIEGFVAGKRKGVFGDRLVAKRPRSGDDDEEMADPGDEVDAMGMTDFTIGDAESRIPRAKPSDQPEHIYGSGLQVPTLPGLLFPYFPEILENDFNYVSAIIKEYFLDCLGDTRDEIMSVYKDVKGSMGSVAQTETGRILQHIFCGISLAVRGQARLFPILDDRGRYLGFTLHGWYFSVSVDGYKHRPVEHAELVKQVRKVDEHTVAIAEIMGVLQKLRLRDSNRTPTKKFLLDHKEECIRNPRALASLVRAFKLEDVETREMIEKLATRLSFPQRYWAFTVDNILRAIDFLVAETFPPDDVPMFPRGGTITADKPAIAVMAAFGECGFSFKTPGGRPLRVPTEISGDTVLKPYKGKGQKEVKPNPTFVLAKKSLVLCVDDWRAFLGDHVFLNKETRDSAFRAIRFGGPPGASFWKGLIDRVGPLDITVGSKAVGDSIELGEDVISDAEDDFEDFL